MSVDDPDDDRTDGTNDYHGHATGGWPASISGWTCSPRQARGSFGSASPDRPANLLAETPDDGWDTPHGRYNLFGGHRLWFAPEDPDRVAIPDGQGLVLDPDRDGIRLTGAVEGPTGLVRSMTLKLDQRRPELEVCHALRNSGDTANRTRPLADHPAATRWHGAPPAAGRDCRSPRAPEPDARPLAIHLVG